MRPEPLVGRAGQRVAAERGDVDRAVRRGVDGVDEDARAGAVRGGDDARQVGDRADRVGGGGDRDPARALPRARPRRRRRAARACRDRARRSAPRAGARGGDEPRRDVGVVVQARADDLVAGLQRSARRRRRSAWSAPSSTGRRRRPPASRRAGARPRRAPARRARRCARGLEGAAVVGVVARAHPGRHLLDGVVDHLGAGGAVEAGPAVGEAGEAGAVHGSGG